MRLLLLSVTLLYSHIIVHGKSKDGWLVLNNGDTLRGQITEQNWSINPSSIEFSVETGKSSIYTTDDLLSFGLANGSRYIKRKTDIDKSEHRSDQVAKKGIKDIVIQTEQVFLKVLIDGHYDLLLLKDKNGKSHFFIESTDYKLKELIVRKIWSSELNQVIVQNLYTAELTNLAMGCDGLSNNTNKIIYKTKELVAFVKKINACKGFGIEYESEVGETIVSISVVGGASSSKIKFESSTISNNLTNGNYPVSVNGYGGLKVNLTFPQNNKRWSLFAETAYKAINTTSKFDYELRVNYLKISMGPQFTFQSTKSKIFLSGALFIGVPLSHKIDGLSSTVVYKTGTKTIDGFRKLEQGVFIGIGSNVTKKIKTEVRFESSSGVSAYLAISSPVKSAYVLLSYQLSNK